MLYEYVTRPLLTSKKAYLEAFSFLAFDVTRNISRVQARAPSRSYPDDPASVDSISKWISTRGRLWSFRRRGEGRSRGSRFLAWRKIRI